MAVADGMRDFGLEVFFSQWEFSARHHMTASDVESMSLAAVLSYGTDEQRDAFDQLWLGYTETWGAPDLRAEIARSYTKLDADHVLCLAGAGEGLYAVARCLLGPEDHAIVPTPNYQSAETIPLTICDVTGIPLRKADPMPQKGGWSLDLEAIQSAIRPNTKLLSLNFPHNPTGMLIPDEDLQALIELCRKNGIYILCDEVYRGIELDPADRMPQIADVYELGISLNVMSKAYGMPGLRVGWIASQNKEILGRVERYKHFLSICNSAPSERLSVIALQSSSQILERNRVIMTENVVLLEKLFDDFPGLVEWSRPMGGCVAYPRYIGPGDVEAFCASLLKESGILLLPASIYVSDLTETPKDHFRLGFGRDAVFKEGLLAMRQHFDVHYHEFAR